MDVGNEVMKAIHSFRTGWFYIERIAGDLGGEQLALAGLGQSSEFHCRSVIDGLSHGANGGDQDDFYHDV